MSSGIEGAATSAPRPPKAFESVISRLRSKVDMTKQLSNRSSSLVSTFIGSPPILSKDVNKSTEEAVKTVILVAVLAEIEQELEENLSEISENLDKLDSAW